MKEVTEKREKKRRNCDVFYGEAIEAINQECFNKEEEFLNVVVCSHLSQTSFQERKICEQFESILTEEALLKDRILQRKQERENQIETEREACVQRELESWKQIKSSLDEKFHALKIQREHERQRKQASKRKEIIKSCKEITWNLVRWIELENEYEQKIGPGAVPRYIQQQWKQMFISNHPDLEIFRTERKTISEEIVDGLVEAETSSYFHFQKEWALKEKIKNSVFNKQLCEWMGEISNAFFIRRREREVSMSSDRCEIKMAMIGPPCSGKTLLCKMLQSEFGIEILEPPSNDPGKLSSRFHTSLDIS